MRFSDQKLMRQLPCRPSGGLIAAAVCAVLLAAAGPLHAVIVQGGRNISGTLDSSGRNLNPAPDNLGNYVGGFFGFLGTPISPQYFVTANHITSATSGTFIYDNGTSTTTSYSATLAGVEDDLAIWKISDSGPAFSLYAPLYTSSTEVGQSLIVLGLGTSRGAAVFNASNQQVGWQWGSNDGQLSWGAGTVGNIVTMNMPGFGGDFLPFAFSRVTDSQGNLLNPDTGILSSGDSGGPIFVKDPADGVYKLAGVNSLVDSVSTTANGTALTDALYDQRGFYNGSMLISGPQPIPMNSYDTRISSRIAFIDSVVPEPATGLAAVLIPAVLLRRKRA